MAGLDTKTIRKLKILNSVKELNETVIELYDRVDALEELLDIADEHGVISEDGKTWRETLEAKNGKTRS